MPGLIGIILEAKEANHQVGKKVKGLTVKIQFILGIIQSCRVVLGKIPENLCSVLVVFFIITRKTCIGAEYGKDEENGQCDAEKGQPEEGIFPGEE